VDLSLEARVLSLEQYYNAALAERQLYTVLQTPSNPLVGWVRIYAKTDNRLYILDSVGVEYSFAYTSQLAEALNDITDVTITSPTDGQVLTYDAASKEWINAAAGGGGDVLEVQVFS